MWRNATSYQYLLLTSYYSYVWELDIAVCCKQKKAYKRRCIVREISKCCWNSSMLHNTKTAQLKLGGCNSVLPHSALQCSIVHHMSTQREMHCVRDWHETEERQSSVIGEMAGVAFRWSQDVAKFYQILYCDFLIFSCHPCIDMDSKTSPDQKMFQNFIRNILNFIWFSLWLQYLTRDSIALSWSEDVAKFYLRHFDL